MNPQPHNAKIELEILNCVLYDASLLDDIRLEPEDFYTPKHNEVFRSAKNLHAAGNAVDVTTVAAELNSRGALEKSGGHDFLLSIGNSIPQTRSLDTYCKLIKQLSIRRRIISECMECIMMAADPEADFELMVSSIATRIGSATDTTDTLDNCVSAHDALQSAGAHIVEVYDGRTNSNAVFTGLVDLDKKLCGMWPGDVVVVAGRPGMGKSALAMSIVKNVSLAGKATILFSLEMSKYLLSLRLLSDEMNINATALRSGNFGEGNFSRIDAAIEKYKSVPFYLDDTATLKVDRIYSVCRQKQKAHGKLGIVAVDYLQLMKSTNKRGNREQEVAEISRSLKIIAKEFDCPVLALSQLNRMSEQRQDKRPTMSELRESGSIEQDADTILFIYRDEVYNEATNDKGIAEIIVGKARSGATGTVKVRFVNEYTRFQNINAYGDNNGRPEYTNYTD